MKKIILGFWLIAISFSTVYAGDLLDGGPKLQEGDASEHRTLTGTVEKIESDMVFLKTEEGTTRNFGIKEAQKEGIKSIKEGDVVVVEFDEGNSIVDIHKKDQIAANDPAAGEQNGMGGPGKSEAGNHRSITGTVEEFDSLKKMLRIKPDNGKVESFEVKDAAFVKLNNIKPGTKVTVEVDEQNRIMDAHMG